MENPLPDRESCHSLQCRKVSGTTEETLRAQTQESSSGSSARVSVGHEGDTAGWLAETLAVPSVQGLGLPPLQELWPHQNIPLSLS